MPKRSPQKSIERRTPGHSPRRAVTPFELEADVLEGLERFGQAELEEHLRHYVKFDRRARAGKLRYSYTGDLATLLDMRSLVAIYLVQCFAVPRPRALLGHQHLTALIEQIATVRALLPAESYQTLRLSAAGEESAIMNRLKAELAHSTGLALAQDEGDLLVRIRRSPDDEGWEALVRISPRPLATRAWRVCNMPGALNATLAHAMMRLSAPHADDRIVNLACGSGTLLVERLALGPAQSAIGCDSDPDALACARDNLRAAGFARMTRLEGWNATDLPLDDRSATVICADLPFGQLVGSHRQNQELYPRIFAEAARIAAPGARMVLVTHEVRLLERVAGDYAQAWRIEQVLPVRSGGMMPRVYLLRRL
jgi:23S rRNA G2445 N2-methylase RlmL